MCQWDTAQVREIQGVGQELPYFSGRFQGTFMYSLKHEIILILLGTASNVDAHAVVHR